MAGHAYTATVEWFGGDGSFADGRYGRGHRWLFDGGVEVPASASPLHVKAPYSRADAVDPEEAYVAALSSCHMLFVLYLAGRRGLVIESYRDEAIGLMSPNAAGKPHIGAVTLRPAIGWGGERRPSALEVETLHHDAHAECYLANSVLTAIAVEPVAAD